MNLSGNTRDAVLMALKTYPNGLTMTELVAETKHRKGWVSMAVRQLQQEELVQCQTLTYSLTQSGMAYTALWVTP